MTYHRNDTTADILHSQPDPDAGPVRCRDYCGAIHRRQRDAALGARLARDGRDFAAMSTAVDLTTSADFHTRHAISRQRQAADAYAQARAMYEDSR